MKQLDLLFSLSLVLALFTVGTPAVAQDDAYYSTLRQQWQDQYQLSGGEWVIGGTESDVFAQTNYYGSLTVTQETVTGQDFSQAVRIQVDSAGPFAFSHAYNFVSQQAINEGDVLLLAVWVRNVLPDDRAVIDFVFEQNVDPFNKFIFVPFSFSSTEWQQVLIPTTATADFASGGSQFHINVGQKKQTIEVGGVAVMNYGSAYTMGDLPEVIPEEPEEEGTYYAQLRQQLQDEYGVSGGEWLLGNNEPQVLSNRIGYGAEFTEVDVEGQPFDQALRVKVDAFGPNPYDQGLLFLANSEVSAGDVVLLVFYVRNIAGDLSQVGINLEENGGNFTKTFSRTTEITSAEWEQIIIPAESVIDHPEGVFKFQLNLGYRPQEFEVGGVAMLNYGDAYTTQQLPSQLPNRTYDGIDAGAPWRAAAQQRIDTNRKGDLTVKVVDGAGNPVPDAQVQVEMQQHAFGFGSAVSIITLEGFRAGDSADLGIYREKLRDLTGDGRTFNIATVENMLKWPTWEGTSPDFITKEQVIEEMNFMRALGMRQRGHNLVWGSGQFLPDDIEEELQQENPDLAKIQQRIRERIPSIMRYPGILGEMVEWDVTNEPLHEGELYDALIGNFGYTSRADILTDWFRRAHEADSTTGLFLNEYDIWTNNPFYRSEYKKLAEEMLAQGAPLTGLGVQAHMGSTLTPIDSLYAILEDLATTGLDLSITEYDASDVKNDSLSALYLRDALTIAFSHPSVTSFVMWGFWDEDHWLGDAPLFYEDWTPKPGYYEYVDLIFNQWWTSEAGKTAADGMYAARGFLGDYAVNVIVGEDTVTRSATLTKDGTTLVVEVAVGNQLPGLVQAESFSAQRGVKLADAQDEDGTPVVVGLDRGDYVDYEVNVRESGVYRFTYRVARERWGLAVFSLTEGDQRLHPPTPLRGTAPNEWAEVEAYAYLEEGAHTLRVQSIGYRWKLNWLLAEPVDMRLPGQIPAEAFSAQGGNPLVLPSGDEDQTTAVSFLRKGAYVEYPVTVAQAGTYAFTYRMRNIFRQKASYQLQLNGDGLHTVSVKRDRQNSFGWQEVSATAELPAGDHTLRLVAEQAGGSINWWSADGSSEDARVAVQSGKKNSLEKTDDFQAFPNPTTGLVKLSGLAQEPMQATVYDLQGRPVLNRQFLPQAAPTLNLSELSPGLYLIRVRADERIYQQRVLLEK